MASQPISDNQGGETRPLVATDDNGVEGHSMLPNMSVNRGIAQDREHDIQRQLRQHVLEAQARQSHQTGNGLLARSRRATARWAPVARGARRSEPARIGPVSTASAAGSNGHGADSS